MQSITFSTSKKYQIVNITKQVKDILKKLNTKAKACLVYTPGATAAIVINEGWDPAVGEDFLDVLDKLAPPDASYKHICPRKNAHAHIKAAILGPSKIIPIKNSELLLGRWQDIFFVELDGPREKREVYVEVL